MSFWITKGAASMMNTGLYDASAVCSRIHKEMEAEMQIQESGDSFLGELIEVLVYQEISRRRCRRQRCRRYY